MARTLLASLLLAAPALGQSVAWLSPSDHRPGEGAEVLIAQVRDEGGEAAAAPWIVPVRLYQRSAFTQRNLQEQGADGPDGKTLRFLPDQPGEWVIGADLPERIEMVPAAELRGFLERHRAGTAPAMQGEVRLRRMESMATMISAPGEAAPISVRKTGQRAEIRPLFDPMTIGTPSTIGLRTYIEGGKITGVLVRATNMATGDSTSFTSDREGIARATIDAPGPWRLEFHHAMPAPAGSAFDLTLYSTTVTFLNGDRP